MTITEEEEKALWKAAIDVQKNSHSPYSKFPVGAAILSEDGKIYSGANIETCAWATTCAERTASVTAASNGARNFKAVMIVSNAEPPAGPCGVCRQVLTEFAGDEMLVLIASPTKIHLRLKLFEDLVPYAFTPKQYQTGL